MRAASVPAEEQYQLIMECRASGQTDYQWCMEHGIKPGTFYNWVKRLRKNGCPDLPAANRSRRQDRQEVVRLEFDQPEGNNNYSRIPDPHPVAFMPESTCGPATAILELVLSGNTIRIPNGTDPVLLEKTLRLLKELSC